MSEKPSSEERLREIILDWKHIWMNQRQNSEADYQNYLSRAFGVDANMQYSLAKMINKEFIDITAFSKLQSQLAEKDKRIEKLEAGLNKIASWDEGKVVTGSFDEPGSAEIAREALADSEGV